MEYAYQARDNNGALRTGTVEALNEASAYGALQEHGLIVIKIIPASKVSPLERIKLFDRVSSKEIVLFSRQFATLINAKVPIVQALNILKNQVSSGKLKGIISAIGQRVESGDSLSSALARYPLVFSNLYVNLVRAAELSGTMDDALSYLANQLEKDNDMRGKVIGAVTYPVFIVGALVIVGILMFIYVLPPLVSILKEASVDLPITTKMLIFVTEFMHKFWWLILGLFIALGVSFRMYSHTALGKYTIDNFKIHIPVFGNLYQKIYMARFARNLSTLVAGGIPIVKALESVADIVGNTVYHEIIIDTAHQVRNGKSVAAALSSHPEFPDILSQMTQIGESTGKLHDILEKLAIFYEKEVDNLLKNLTTLLEPIIMMILGMAVAIMVAGILLPIYNLASAA